MSPSSLPPNPKLEALKKQAKAIQKAHKANNAACCEVLRNLNRFARASDAEILAADISLKQVQFALAMDYGFASWPAMKAYVDSVASEDSAYGVEGDGETRLVLQGVPKVGFHTGKLCPFPACMESVLTFLGHPEPYHYLMGVSGAAFRRIWHPEDGGNVDLGYLFPEPHRLLFRAIGYDYRALPCDDRNALLAAVRQSIADGRPVIAFGIVGPPEAEIVAGYDEGGNVLLGHSYFDFEQRPAEQPYFARENWYAPMRGNQPTHGEPTPMGMIVIGDRHPRPESVDILRESLSWAIELSRVPRRANMPQHVCGLAAYEAWAEWLESDVEFAEDKPTTPEDPEHETAPRSTMETRAMVHGDQCTMLWERAEAAAYLRRMASSAGPAEDLLQEAAGLYQQISEADVWPWKAKHYMADEVKRGLMDPETRRAFAVEIRRVGATEALAVKKLQAALEAMS